MIIWFTTNFIRLKNLRIARHGKFGENYARSSVLAWVYRTTKKRKNDFGRKPKGISKHSSMIFTTDSTKWLFGSIGTTKQTKFNSGKIDSTSAAEFRSTSLAKFS